MENTDYELLPDYEYPQPILDDFLNPFFSEPAKMQFFLDDLVLNIWGRYILWKVQKELEQSKALTEQSRIRSLGRYIQEYNGCNTIWQTNLEGDIIRNKHGVVKDRKIQRFWPRQIKLKEIIGLN